MIPGTVEALGIVAVAVIPGATYIWTFERQAGSFGVSLADRVLRFIAASVVVHAFLAWLEYLAWRTALSGGQSLDAWRFLILWLTGLVVVGVPAAVGTTVGYLYASRNQRERYPRLRRALGLDGDEHRAREEALLQVVLGRAPAPRAWDHLFSRAPSGVVRAQLKRDGSWVGGLYGEHSYASGFPESPEDLYLEQAYLLQADGSFADSDGEFTELGSALLIRADECAVLEFFHTEEA